MLVLLRWRSNAKKRSLATKPSFASFTSQPRSLHPFALLATLKKAMQMDKQMDKHRSVHLKPLIQSYRSDRRTMGLCASMLRRRARNRHPEPRRGTPTALFVVRGDRRPEPLVFRVQDSGRAQLQKPPRKPESGRRDRCWQQGADAPDRTACARVPRLATTRSTAGVEPGEPPSTRRTATATAGRGAPMAPGRYGTPPTEPTTTASPLIVPGTPASTAMTPGRPVWQRRILMGMRCELPRFSGLLLYDEHGRPIHIATPGRRNHRQGKKKTATARTTFHDSS